MVMIVRGCLVVSAPDCQSSFGQIFGSRFLLYIAPLANFAMMITLPCQWEDVMVRERTGHLPSYSKAKKMKSLTLHTHGCRKASLRD